MKSALKIDNNPYLRFCIWPSDLVASMSRKDINERCHFQNNVIHFHAKNKKKRDVIWFVHCLSVNSLVKGNACGYLKVNGNIFFYCPK